VPLLGGLKSQARFCVQLLVGLVDDQLNGFPIFDFFHMDGDYIWWSILM